MGGCGGDVGRPQPCPPALANQAPRRAPRSLDCILLPQTCGRTRPAVGPTAWVSSARRLRQEGKLVIPIEDTPGERRRTFPVVTLLLIAANVVVFAYQISLGPDVVGFIRSLGAVPAEIVSGQDLPPPSPTPVYLTLLTSMFIHAGFLHLGGNMLFLWIFGDNVEDAFGHPRFLGLYLFCGIFAGLVHIAMNPESQVPAIGASGAIAGVLAAYLLLFPHATVRTLLFVGPFVTITRVSAIFMIGVWILFQLVSGLLALGVGNAEDSGVAFWAHIGGFVAGLMVVGAWRAIDRLRSGEPLA